jgi:hypothetical protein
MAFISSYVGPAEVLHRLTPVGRVMGTRQAAEAWLTSDPDSAVEGCTFVLGVDRQLRLAPRRSEHVACAGSTEVLAAGELRFARHGEVRVVEVTNQSTGFCPDLDSYPDVARALERAGLKAPPTLTHSFVFRRCLHCHQINAVKEAWFFCAVCDRALPAVWNVGVRRVL